jgi:hypothetical protein
MGDMPSSSSTSADASSAPSMAGATVNMVTMTTELFQTIMGQLASAAAPPTTTPGVSGTPAAQVAHASDASIPVFVAPGATGTPSRESLLDNFPSVPRATILEIVRYEFHPLNLYKLDPVAQEKATDARNTMDIEDGHFTIRERTGTPKDYPTFASLLEPLLTYFEILGSYAASSGNIGATLTIFRGSAAYCTHLSTLYRSYTWAAIIQYHKQFFLKRSKEMARGIYSEWASPDLTLMGIYLVGHYRTPAPSNIPKSKPSASTTTSSTKTPVASQTCFPFNKGTCTGATCPAGRIHKCQKCDSTTHGSFACTKAT